METKFQPFQDERNIVRYRQRRGTLMTAFEIIDQNPGMTLDEIAAAVQKAMKLKQKPKIETVASWICRKSQIERQEKLKNHVELMVFNALHKKDCQFCALNNPYTNRCSAGYETEAERIDILAGKVFCHYFQKWRKTT